MTWEAFGRALLTTQDLDPIYTMLVRAGDANEAFRTLVPAWCVVYWLIYHAGATTDLLRDAAIQAQPPLLLLERRLDRLPRGRERRHFRGAVAHRAVAALRVSGSPETLVERVFSAPLRYSDVAARLQTFPMFGPWISWKAADMGERVLGYPVDFTGVGLEMYSEPRKGAAIILHGNPEARVTREEMDELVQRMMWEFRDFPAPPRFDRAVNVQEVETVLCKYKAHLAGHYPVGMDSHEVRIGLVSGGPTSRWLATFVPKVT